ncbi:MAG TPA: carboxypeptidase-like regulatory domain-containing protein, partial [Verrucomicrobiae bacterium]|nr:carboxypeptidase-like regulatory domain-containing protein [Verrucomicrobiae bacterium]
MKPFSSVLKTALRLLVFPLGLLLCQTLPAAVSFTVTPSAVSNTYTGNLTLQVAGLTNGETVVVQKFLDANTNSTVDAADLLVQQFQLKDGQASLFGTVTNINVPGDTDSTAGQITAQLIFQNGDFVQKIAGKYAFKLSSPSGNFAPLTNSFSVTDFPYLQSITGSVVSSGTNVANASIILFPPPRPGHGPGSPLGGTVANDSGNYSIKVSPGVYTLLAFKSNYLANAATAPVVTVNSGATVATNLVLANATQNISGKIADAATNSIGLPGLGLHGSASGLIAFGFSDTNGNFTLRVSPGQWGLGTEGLAAHGYIGFDSDNFSVNTTTGSVSGVIVAYPKATALFYGSVKDDQ